MDHYDRPIRQVRARRFAPTVEGLETRQLLTFFSPYWYSSSYSYNQLSYQAAVVRHEYDTYVSGLKRLELASQATPAEYLALRDDARASPRRRPRRISRMPPRSTRPWRSRSSSIAPLVRLARK